MRLIENPTGQQLLEILKRPVRSGTQIDDTVRSVLNQVKAHGDSAILQLTEKFDKVKTDKLQVSLNEFNEASKLVPDVLKDAIAKASINIEKFHLAQRGQYPQIETSPGVKCWQKPVAIEKVGLYIPGGTAPLFSTVLMLGIPAIIAGCREIILCTPPGKDGKIHPAILYAAQQTGITKVFKAGGIQAIGAMAYGTESIPMVYKIFGPGNQYVTAAKQLVARESTAIDMPAGPSEVAVMADDSSNIGFIASDLLSQAEHGTDSQVILVTTSRNIFSSIEATVRQQLNLLPRKEIAEKALEHARIILVDTEQKMLDIINRYAPEHLVISTQNSDQHAEQIINAGSVFIGPYTPESAGDYASGTNHTLPTYGFARNYSGVNLDSFMRKITYQKISANGLQALGPVIETMAEAEMLHAHKNAVTLRLDEINKPI